MDLFTSIVTKRLHFTENDNNKLNCNCFSMICKDNYRVGELYKIDEGGFVHGIAEVVSVSCFFLKDLSNSMAFIDMGISKQQAEKKIKKMYPKTDLANEKLSFIILKYRD